MSSTRPKSTTCKTLHFFFQDPPAIERKNTGASLAVYLSEYSYPANEIVGKASLFDISSSEQASLSSDVESSASLKKSPERKRKREEETTCLLPELLEENGFQHDIQNEMSDEDNTQVLANLPAPVIIAPASLPESLPNLMLNLFISTPAVNPGIPTADTISANNTSSSSLTSSSYNRRWG